MITLPKYAKKHGYKYKAINEIINFLNIEPDQQINHFRSFDENKLDSLFVRLSQLKNYTPQPPTHSDDELSSFQK